MRFVIALFIPAMKKGAVKRLVCYVSLIPMAFVASELSYKLRNPLAFVHGELSFIAAQIMSKPALISFSDREVRPPEDDSARPPWRRHHRR
jgi:hypothetical protein